LRAGWSSPPLPHRHSPRWCSTPVGSDREWRLFPRAALTFGELARGYPLSALRACEHGVPWSGDWFYRLAKRSRHSLADCPSGWQTHCPMLRRLALRAGKRTVPYALVARHVVLVRLRLSSSTPVSSVTAPRSLSFGDRGRGDGEDLRVGRSDRAARFKRISPSGNDCRREYLAPMYPAGNAQRLRRGCHVSAKRKHAAVCPTTSPGTLLLLQKRGTPMAT